MIGSSIGFLYRPGREERLPPVLFIRIILSVDLTAIPLAFSTDSNSTSALLLKKNTTQPLHFTGAKDLRLYSDITGK